MTKCFGVKEHFCQQRTIFSFSNNQTNETLYGTQYLNLHVPTVGTGPVRTTIGVGV